MSPTTPRERAAFVLATAVITLRGLVPGLRPGGQPGVHPASVAHPSLQAGAERLAAEVGVDRVTVYVWDAPAPNLFAVGSPRRAHVVVSTPAVEALTEEELLACVGHELAHARHGHARSLTTALAGGLALAAGTSAAVATRRGHTAGLVAGLLAAAAAGLVSLALVRETERTADRSGAIETGNGAALASALATVHSGDTVDDPSTYEPPRRGLLARLLATHPPVRERLAYLTGPDGDG